MERKKVLVFEFKTPETSFQEELINFKEFVDNDEICYEKYKNVYITGYPCMLNYAWEAGCEVYLVNRFGKMDNVKEISDKELRPEHNITNLFLKGHFDYFMYHDRFEKNP